MSESTGPGPGIPITLTWGQVHMATNGGTLRRIAALQGGKKDAYDMDPGLVWYSDVEGCGGEIAVAQWAGVPWEPTLGRTDADDVGEWQVRTTQYHETGLLRLHKPDKDHKVFVLVTGQIPDLSLRGWAYAHEGKHDQYWHTLPGKKRYAYWLPIPMLRPMSTLPRGPLKGYRPHYPLPR